MTHRPNQAGHIACHSNKIFHSFINRPIRASKDLHIGENSFLDLSLHINWPIRASQDLHSGEKCFVDFSLHINGPIRASQNLHGD